MAITRSQLALNPIQWINIKADPTDPTSEDLWLFGDPNFRAQYPDVLRQIRTVGFDTVMMEVLDTQTLQDYASMIADAGLKLAPGYAQVALPEDHGVTLTRGSAEWVRWFDGVRRKAEESNYFGLSSIFLAPEVSWEPGCRRMHEATAVGAGFDQDRLARVVDILTDAAEVLKSEGVTAGLHNHVGTWIETEHEINFALENTDPSLLRAAFDIGHLAWAGIDPVTMIAKYADRISDLHIKDLDLDVAARSRLTPTPYRTAVDQGLFLEPGLGGMDLDGVFGALPADFGGSIIIEVDRASMDPLESAQVTWEWLQRNVPAS